MYYFIILFLICFLSSIPLSFNIYNLKLININIKETLQVTLIIFIITYIFQIFKIEFLGTPLIFICVYIFLSFKNKKKLQLFISLILSYLIFSTVDIVLGSMILEILNIDMTYFQNDMFLRTFIIFPSILVSLIISRLISIIVLKFDLNKNTNKNSKMTFIIFLNLIIVTTILYINAIINKMINTDTTIITLNSVWFVIYFISTIVLTYFYGINLKNTIEYENKNKQINQLKEYTSTLERMFNDVRKFKHDYVNILSTMNGYLESEDVSNLKNYFNKNIIPLSDSITKKNTRLGLLQHVKIISLKGLLSSKLIHAHSMNIDTFIDITEDITKINMDMISLCRILGILFDNAIEAAVNCKNPKLEFGMIKKEKSIIIVLINSCDKQTPPVYKLFKKGFSTKGTNRGVGLSTVKELVDNNSNITLNTSIESSMFKQELIIGKN